MEEHSPIIAAVLGIIAAAFGIWLTIHFVNRGKKPSARLCAGVLLVIAAIGLAIWLPYHREQQIVEKINGWWGARLRNGDGGVVEMKNGGPDWLISLVGYERMKVFDRVERVDLDGSAITDADVAQLCGLTRLRQLSLDKTPIGNEGLAHLSEMKDLEWLLLRETKITNSDLVHLSGLRGLRHLYLSGTKIGDAGLDHLKEMTNLESLVLDGTQVSDSGMAHLKGLTNLRQLDLGQTQVGDAGLVHLSELPNLIWLNLARTKVSDAGFVHLNGFNELLILDLDETAVTDTALAHLGKLPKLHCLSLNGTQISDAGLVHLSGLTKLESLGLGTQITNEGIESLQKALPRCKIYR